MADLHSYALVSLQDTKDYLGISNSNQDNKLKILINMVTDYIEGRCQRRFKRTTYTGPTAEVYSGEGRGFLSLRAYPVESISSIEENRNWDGGTAEWSALDAGRYYTAGEDFEAGIIHGVSPFYSGQGNYRISYVGGYETIPSDLQYAAMELVGEALRGGGKSAGIKSESLGDHSITFESLTGSETSRVEKIIQRYRRMTIL